MPEETKPAAVATMDDAGTLADLSFTDFEKFRKTGEQPSAKPKGEEEKKTSEANDKKGEEEKPVKAGTEGESETPEDQEKKKAEKALQRRINDLTRRRYEAEARADAAEKRLAERTAAPAKTEEKPTATAEGKPQVEKFTTYEDYVEALADWKAGQKIAEAEAKRAEEKAAETRRAQLSGWKKKVETAMAAHEDFDETMSDDVPMTAAMREAMLDSEHGAEIAYFLGKNPEEAERIAGLSDVAAVRAIGRIEASLEKATPEKAKPKAESKKPEPINPLKSGRGSSGPVDLMDPKLSFKDFERAREAEIRANR